MNNDLDTQYEDSSSTKDTVLNAFLVAGTVAGCALMFAMQAVPSVVA